MNNFGEVREKSLSILIICFCSVIRRPSRNSPTSSPKKNPSIYVASRPPSSRTAAATLRDATAMGSYSTSFKEEKDTFTPSQVFPLSSMSYQSYNCCFCVKFWGSSDAEMLQNLKSVMSASVCPIIIPVVCAFGVLKKCAPSIAIIIGFV
ncbi:hypothetical protein HID58_017535 [Brassica napus]|uniref:Uncharacterized protein n=1 Tax=Brassica napus TaxID=3708 RepID=A0ABQ8D7D5_BRANA|nr:hypothetical protein HID58_017535 [Brassica napus]